MFGNKFEVYCMRRFEKIKGLLSTWAWDYYKSFDSLDDALAFYQLALEGD
jgi:hypothetical protein